jgi:vancomycin resistance protein YoaR
MAVSDDTLQRRRAIRVPRPGVKFLVFVVSTLLGIAAVAGGIAAYHGSLVGRIMPGVSVAGVSIGGLSPDEARAALTEQLRALSEGGVTVRSSIGSTTIKFADVGRAADIDAMVVDAATLGHGGTWLDETIAGLRLRLDPKDVPLKLRYDHELAATALSGFAQRMTLGSIDASIVTATTGFYVHPSTDGSRLDDAAALAAVDAAMRDPATPSGFRVDAPVISVAPRLTTDMAEQARLASSLMAVDLRVTSGKLDWTIRAGRIRTWIGFGWVDGEFRPVIDRTAIPTKLKLIAPRVARPVVDAAFLRDKRGRIVGAAADHAGRELDMDATAERIATALEARATGSPAASAVKLSLVAILPKRTTEEVARTAPLMVKVGGWTTHYQVAAHNGFGANITVPARYLNGTVVAPGQLFDFWGGLGEVSFRTGYRLGGAIVGGHSVEGKALAGGICAASTTLFNAALRGGYEIVSRQPHWYYITRYPLGLDATVSGSQSMRFRNDTAFPILIRGFASPGMVRFEIWSVPNGRTVSLSRPQVSNVVPGADSVVRTTSLKKGTSLRIEWPVDGKDVVVTRTVRDASGRVIHHEVYVSHYHRMIGINQIGIG